jgi:hypothetical protein
MAFLAGWSKRQKLTIDHTQVDDELTDFPVKVIVSSDNPLFDTAKSDGSDVRFTAADGETLLKFEREVHDTTEKIAVYHVKIPSVSSTSDTDFYLYYGNASASDASSPNDVWDSNYKLVMHMGSSLEDSTSNGNDGTNYGSTLGLASDGYYRSFDGNDYISTSLTIPALSVADDYTWECMVKNHVESHPYSPIIGNRLGGSSSPLAFIKLTSIQFEWYVGGQEGITLASAIGTSDFEVHIVQKDGASLVHFVDGTRGNSSTISSAMPDTNPFFIGGDPGKGEYSECDISEVRISSVARSDAWIKATSASLHNNLLTFGSEESAAPPIQGVHQGVQIIFI